MPPSAMSSFWEAACIVRQQCDQLQFLMSSELGLTDAQGQNQLLIGAFPMSAVHWITHQARRQCDQLQLSIPFDLSLIMRRIRIDR